MNCLSLVITAIFLFPPEDSGEAGPATVDQIKGFTRSTVIALILIAASELDHSDPSTPDKLKPLHKVLDKCWMVPCHVF